MTNDFSYGAEQPQICFASISELSPLVINMLRSKAMKLVTDISAITYTVMYREAILKLGMALTKIYIH